VASLLFLALVAAGCIAAPYALGVRPTTSRHWTWLAITVGFLAWVLPLMVSLRSR